MRQRLHEARFPEVKTLDTFDFTTTTTADGLRHNRVASGSRPA